VNFPQLIKALQEVRDIIQEDNKCHAPSPQRSARISAIDRAIAEFKKAWEAEENLNLFEVGK